MKKTICLVAVIALLTLSAVAQRGAINRTALGDNGQRSGNPATPPTYCNPCLFYGGDWDPNSQWVVYFNADNTGGYDATVYTPFKVPAGRQWKVNGLFTNNLDTTGIGKTDPNTAPWEIRSGMSEGNGGTLVASGTSNSKFTSTGRNYQNVYFEYTLQVKTPVTTLAAGTYWLAVTPQCTNTSDSACSSAFYYQSDTIGGANKAGPPEPGNMTFHNSTVFGLNYTNVCNEGYPPPACTRMSAGVTGKQGQGN